jgi:limonene-1,2-epoxide hydrolase
MKARMVTILALLIALVTLNVPSAQASIEPIVAVNSFFTALNASDHEAAVATFTPDAVATLVRGETYRGPEGISHMVELMEHTGRHYEIVQAHMMSNTVTVVVEVSDDGIRWGEDVIVVEVREGKLYTFYEKAFHLRLGS